MSLWIGNGYVLVYNRTYKLESKKDPLCPAVRVTSLSRCPCFCRALLCHAPGKEYGAAAALKLTDRSLMRSGACMGSTCRVCSSRPRTCGGGRGDSRPAPAGGSSRSRRTYSRRCRPCSGWLPMCLVATWAICDYRPVSRTVPLFSHSYGVTHVELQEGVRLPRIADRLSSQRQGHRRLLGTVRQDATAQYE